MDTIVARYQWNVEELTKAYRWHLGLYARPVFRVAFWLLLFLICVVGTFLFIFESKRDGAIAVGIGGFFLISLTAAAAWLARRQIRRDPNQNAEIECRLSPEEFQIIAPRSGWKAEWSLLFKTVETPDGLLLYFVPQAFFWLPRSSFTSDMEYLSAVQLAKKNSKRFVECPSPRKHSSILRGFRFRLQNLLWTTFWVCAWAAALSHLITFVRDHRPLQGIPWWSLTLHVWFPLFIVVWSPAVAIGALFNRARRGALIGLTPVAVIFALVLSIIVGQ
jgi:hypothetical protein